jgi:hypothetical protein
MRIDSATRSMLKSVAELYQRSPNVKVEAFFKVWDELAEEMKVLRQKQPGTMEIEGFFREAKKRLLGCL